MFPGLGGTTFPGAVGQGTALRNIWPNEDGRSWEYSLLQRAWDRPIPHFYDRPALVPPAPRLDVVMGLLRRHPIGRHLVASDGRYTMRFNGLKTTLSGATGQNLETQLLFPPVAASAAAAPIAPIEGPIGFMAALERARPDIARKAGSRGGPPRAPSAIIPELFAPTFLFGYAWEKTDQYIGSYGDLNTELAWKYLDANLRPGSSFRMQLVPDLADDVFLHARVLSQQTAFSGTGAVRSAIQVLYLIDFGVGEWTDVNGNTVGFTRVYSYGTITYAPGVGPVASYERNFIESGSQPGPGEYDQTLRLAHTSPGPPPG